MKMKPPTCGCNNCEICATRRKRENKIPKLEVGMVFEYEWEVTGRVVYLYLGDWRTIELSDNTSDRSQPLRSGNFEGINRIYSSSGMQSIDDCRGVSEYSTRTLIWEKTPPKSPTQLKIEELEKSSEEIANQIKELKELNN